MYDHSSFKKARKRFWKRWRIPDDQDYPVDLPLVDRWRKKKKRHEDKASSKVFDGFHVLFIQHHLGPFLGRMRAMFEDGLIPENCWFVDIPYSTNAYVWNQLRDMGCPAEQAALPFNDPYAPYGEAQLRRTCAIVERIVENAPDTLLVVDDGAYFLRALESLRDGDFDASERFGPEPTNISVCIVEQTTRGFRYLSDPAIAELIEELEAPVVSVARSFTKTKLEAPFIGEAIARGVRNAVEKCPRGASPGAIGKTAILGCGVVGQATLMALREMAPEDSPPIDIIDHDQSTRQRAVDLKAEWLPRLPRTRDESDRYDLVVGCTGFGSFGVGHRSLLRDGALLISGSSAAVEFNRARFIEVAKQPDFESLEIMGPEPTQGMKIRDQVNGSIHADLTLQAQRDMHSGQSPYEFTFFNAGFPVNFTGHIESLPVPLIQPTHSLLYAASVQAIAMLKRKEARVCELNEDDDIWLFIEGVREINDKRLWRMP